MFVKSPFDGSIETALGFSELPGGEISRAMESGNPAGLRLLRMRAHHRSGGTGGGTWLREASIPSRRATQHSGLHQILDVLQLVGGPSVGGG